MHNRQMRDTDEAPQAEPNNVSSIWLMKQPCRDVVITLCRKKKREIGGRA